MNAPSPHRGRLGGEGSWERTHHGGSPGLNLPCAAPRGVSSLQDQEGLGFFSWESKKIRNDHGHLNSRAINLPPARRAGANLGSVALTFTVVVQYSTVLPPKIRKDDRIDQDGRASARDRRPVLVWVLMRPTPNVNGSDYMVTQTDPPTTSRFACTGSVSSALFENFCLGLQRLELSSRVHAACSHHAGMRR